MRHGGEIYGELPVKYDFSVNINPLGIPENVREALIKAIPLVDRYPDQSSNRLREALEKEILIPKEHIICGNGASELISMAILAVKPSKVLLPSPSFLGYEKAVRAAEAEIEWYYTSKDRGFSLDSEFIEKLQESRDIDMIILCSPGNPVGNLIPSDLLCEIAECCEEKGIYLMVDECFLGFLPDGEKRSMRRLLERTYSGPESGPAVKRTFSHLFVLDAFTKRYALPGIRLGYLTSDNEDLINRIKELQPEWSVSVLAEEAGIAALQTPEAYLGEARSIIIEERAYLEEALKSFGARVYEGKANYIFFETEKAIYEPLIKKGFLIRHCDNYEGLSRNFYRISIKRHEENEVLVEALTALI